MSKNKRQHSRRDFIVTSAGLLSGAIVSAALPLRLGARQLSGAQEINRTLLKGARLSAKGINMLTVRPEEIGAQLFGSIPAALRSDALQLRRVQVGIKPACRLSLRASELAECLPYLRTLNLAIVIEQAPQHQLLYAQLSPQRRKKLTAESRVRVYLAKSEGDARKLAETERRGDYRATGLALGFPSCCVEVAVKYDRAYFDEKNHEWRQANLNAEAARASTTVDFRCNQLLVESELCGVGPLSAIAHNPCKLDCRESAAIGQAALECCARTWPIWSVLLCEIMRAPMFYWSDAAWQPEYWDECCGIALLGGRQVQDSVWNSDLPAMMIGAERTPAGKFPRNIVIAQIAKGHLLLENLTGSVTALSFEKSGPPWFINWRAGTIEKLS